MGESPFLYRERESNAGAALHSPVIASSLLPRRDVMKGQGIIHGA